MEHKKNCIFRLTDEQLKQLKALAEKEGKTQTEKLTELIKEAFERS